MMPLCLATQNEHLLTLTLNRPDKLNTLTVDVLNELSKHLDEAAQDASIRGVLINGSGKAFCAGADVSQFASFDALKGHAFATLGQKVFRQLETLGKPSMAVIHGFALGGGCELAMAATFRIAAQDARLGQPEIKLGIIPGFGGTQRLARLVGKGRALDLCLTGRLIDAETALNWGLLNELTTPDALLNRATLWMNEVMAMPPLALKSAMSVIDAGFDLPLTDAMNLEALHFANLCASEDKNEGVAAFLGKRQPMFKGR